MEQNNNDPYQRNTKLSRQTFNKVASCYEQVDIIQQHTALEIFKRLDLVKITPDRVLDVGCATGRMLVSLARRYKKAHIIGMDSSHTMLINARQKRSWFSKKVYVEGDGEQIPLKNACIDLLIANGTLHYCDTKQAIKEYLRVLKPGGLMMFTTLGLDTLKQLRDSWRSVDQSIHVDRFEDMHKIGDIMQQAGLVDPVMDVEYLELAYHNLSALMRDLKMNGGHNLNAGRPRGLNTKGVFNRLTAAYEAFRIPNKGLPATFEIIYGHGWAPLQSEHLPGAQQRTELEAQRLPTRFV